MSPVTSAGKHATGEERGKNVTNSNGAKSRLNQAMIGSKPSLAEMRLTMAKANWLVHSPRNQSLSSASKTNKTSAAPISELHYSITDLFCLFAGALRSSLY